MVYSATLASARALRTVVVTKATRMRRHLYFVVCAVLIFGCSFFLRPVV